MTGSAKTTTKKLTVKELLQEKHAEFKLELLAGAKGLERTISVIDINRPGLAVGGFFDHFRAERIQLIGRGEHAYLSSSGAENRKDVLKQFLAFKGLPCVILTRGLDVPRDLKEVCEEAGVPLLRTQWDTAQFISEVSVYLEDKLSPSTTVHGVLVDVYGLGVLLLGESGIGKSECAIELVKRGHMLVSDDVVNIQHHSGGILFGTSEETIKHHMEVRGLGIIDIRAIFGVGAILDKTRIELVIRLEMWEPNKEYERLGLEERTTDILDVPVPEVILPVRPGRNLAVLIEIAALNQRLKSKGQHSARELNQRLIDLMRKKE